MRTMIAALIILPALAHAQGLPSITGDFTGDGIENRAELTDPDELGMAGLELYVGQVGGGEVLATQAPSLIWVGGIGQQPELSINARGELQIISMNIAIGRDRWHQTLTIAYDGDQFLLVGFGYDWYDPIDLAIQGECAIILGTGQGLLILGFDRTETRFQIAPRIVEIQNWQPNIPDECGLN